MSNQSKYGNIRELLDTIRAIAQEGLSYSQNEYDSNRYTKLLELARNQYASITGLNITEIQEIFRKEQGSITPKVGVDISIMSDKGKLLLLKRKDGTWGMPGGWADVGESPFETAEREAFEETGITITPVGYVTIAHKTPASYPGFVSQVNICVMSKQLPADQSVVLSSEHLDYRWIDENDSVEDWHPGQKRLLLRVFEAYRNQSFIPDTH